MSLATHPPKSEIPSDEIKERVEEYRLLGFKRQAPPQVVYESPMIRALGQAVTYASPGLIFS